MRTWFYKRFQKFINEHLLERFGYGTIAHFRRNDDGSETVTKIGITRLIGWHRRQH